MEIFQDVSTVIYLLVAYLLGGGTVIAAIAIVASRILNSPVLLAALENLAKSMHPDTLKSLNVTARLVDELTDGIPHAEKTTKVTLEETTTTPPAPV